jgi:hypothetical protein
MVNGNSRLTEHERSAESTDRLRAGLRIEGGEDAHLLDAALPLERRAQGGAAARGDESVDVPGHPHLGQPLLEERGHLGRVPREQGELRGQVDLEALHVVRVEGAAREGVPEREPHLVDRLDPLRRARELGLLERDVVRDLGPVSGSVRLSVEHERSRRPHRVGAYDEVQGLGLEPHLFVLVDPPAQLTNGRLVDVALAATLLEVLERAVRHEVHGPLADLHNPEFAQGGPELLEAS